MTADALMAFRRGRDDDQAFLGALILADAIDCLRVVRSALTKR